MSLLPAGAPSRFDAVLLAMGGAVGLGLSVGILSAVPLAVGGGAGSLVAGAVLADGLVRHPPTGD